MQAFHFLPQQFSCWFLKIETHKFYLKIADFESYDLFIYFIRCMKCV